MPAGEIATGGGGFLMDPGNHKAQVGTITAYNTSPQPDMSWANGGALSSGPWYPIPDPNIGAIDIHATNGNPAQGWAISVYNEKATTREAYVWVLCQS